MKTHRITSVNVTAAVPTIYYTGTALQIYNLNIYITGNKNRDFLENKWFF
jgi:hypothetical protein